MKKLFTLVFILASFNTYAEVVYTFGKTIRFFEKVDGIYVNKSCEDKKCEAYKKFQEFTDRSPAAEERLGGKNPNAVKCKTMMGGKVYIGKKRDGHEQSFCVFKDDSYLKN